MDRRFLLAIDGSERSLEAVRLLGQELRGRPGCEVTLFHVTPVPPALLEHEGAERPAEERALERELGAERRSWLDGEEERIERRIFAPAKALLDGGRPGSVTVRTKVCAEAHPDAARAILEELRAGGYDAVVVGRTGMGKVTEKLLGSTASQLQQALPERRLWIRPSLLAAPRATR